MVKEKVDKEIAMGRLLVAGPSNKEPLGNLRLSPIWNVAKKDGLWSITRLIVLFIVLTVL